jgi:hypothetical protein
MKACVKQQTEWTTRIAVIASSLQKSSSRAIQDGWLKMKEKLVLTAHILQSLRRRFQEKSYLGHLSSTETFEERSKLATVSTALCECLEFISNMTTIQAKQFETVCELVNVYIFKVLTEHLNSAHKKNSQASFEITLYWSYLEMNQNESLRQRTIAQIRVILKDAPAMIIFYRSYGMALRSVKPNGFKDSFEKKPYQNEKLLWTTR